jgi:hypothetical protein
MGAKCLSNVLRENKGVISFLQECLGKVQRRLHLNWMGRNADSFSLKKRRDGKQSRHRPLELFGEGRIV